MKRTLLVATTGLLLSGCGGGGSVPQVFPIAGSYYGTVVSSANNSGNMGLTTDSVGNGNFAVQFPGQPVVSETFAPPVSSVNGDTLTVNGSIASGCNFSMTATMADANDIKGHYTLTCPGLSPGSANFTLPRGTYSVAAKHRMTGGG